MVDKSKKQQYLDAIKSMTPGAVLEFVSKQLEINPVKFLATNAGWLALAAAKNGWVKATEIKDAIKDFSKKNKEDNTGIDFENVEVDEDTMKFMCLLDGDSMKKLDEFVKNYYDDLKDFGKECEEADEKLHKDAKAKDIKLSDDEIDKHGMTVAGVIDDENNKKVSGKELTAEIKQRIEIQKELEEIEKKRAALARKLKAIDTDDVEDEKKPKNESMHQAYRRGKLIVEAAGKPIALPIATVRKISDWYKDNMDKVHPEMAEIKAKLRAASTVSSFAGSEFMSYDYHNPKMPYEEYQALEQQLQKLRMDAPLSFNCHEISQTINGKGVKYIVTSGDKNFWNMVEYAREHPEVAGDINAIEQEYVKRAAEAAGALKDAAKEKAEGAVDKAISAQDNAKQVGSPIKSAADARKVGGQVYVATGQTGDADDFQVNYKAGPGGMPFPAKAMEDRFDNIEDIFDDKKLTVAEYKQYKQFAVDMMSYEEWAAANADSDDPQVLQRIAQIKRMSAKLNEFELEHGKDLDRAANLRLGKFKNGNRYINTSQDTTSKETQEEVKKKTGMKMFTGLGLARLAARTTGYVLNHGKDLVNALGARSIKKKEDKGIVAEVTVLLTNGKESDTKFSDTKFSVRFNIYDMKWHATNLDDRKMKFPEDTVVKKVLDTDMGKKFKAACLKKWSNVFEPEDKSKKIVADILSNPKKTQLKLDGDTEKFIDMVSEIGKNFDEVKQQFK